MGNTADQPPLDRSRDDAQDDGKNAADRAAVWPAADSLADACRVAPPHPAVIDEDALQRACRMSQLRRSGPGGQHRNKVSTAISWSHQPTGISAEASESRDQARNRREALQRLRLRLAIRVRTDSTTGQVAGGSPEEARIRTTWSDRKLKVSARHADYPAVLALVLDDLHRSGGQPSLVGRMWQASTTAVVSLVAQTPPAMVEVNRWREHHGRRGLRG